MSDLGPGTEEEFCYVWIGEGSKKTPACKVTIEYYPAIIYRPLIEDALESVSIFIAKEIAGILNQEIET